MKNLQFNPPKLLVYLLLAVVVVLFTAVLLIGPHEAQAQAEPPASITDASSNVDENKRAEDKKHVDEEQPDKEVEPQAATIYWVILRQKADLSAAHSIQDWNERGKFVIEQLQTSAIRSQAGLNSFLTSRGVEHRRFWIANTIQVKGDETLRKELEARPEVAQVIIDQPYHLHPVQRSTAPANLATPWGIERIRATEAWSAFGIQGEEIVVANIDTGVEYNHPALVAQYRGNQGDGTFDHNYNWFDPAQACDTPSLVPCDNNGHGTHTMGTIVGHDGNAGDNQIGVAPNARWITAKGCETSSCARSALLAAGEWMLAPTDLNGNNPRVDLRPHIVNNSWGGSSGGEFYQAIVASWVAAGIFPAFSNGNSGPGCNTSDSPGDYVDSYSVGAFDSNNSIASFSSRGDSDFGGFKPNISAPGVDVRSSLPGGSYGTFSGTSMASPHVAGTVALMWSAAPSLIGDIDGTRALLNQTAIDTEDLSCGGTAENNNVWGEGRLDAFAAVDLSPRGPAGTLEGTVTDASSGNPLPDVVIEMANDSTRTTVTDLSGKYSRRLSVGDYSVTASTFGFVQQTETAVTISENVTTTRDFALEAAPAQPVTGAVRNENGQPIANATVTILGTPIMPAVTDENGVFSFASVPEAEYEVEATAGACNAPQTQTYVVNGAANLDFVLPQVFDAFGYYCQVMPATYIEGSTDLPLTGDDSSTAISLPFPFYFYGETYSTAYVSTNGFLNFLGYSNSPSNGRLPNTSGPNAAIYPFWDDLVVDSTSSMHTELIGNAPNRQFVIEWRNVFFYSDFSKTLDFQVILSEDGDILTQYRNIADDEREQGNSATVGIEDHTGTTAFQYSYGEAAIGSPEFAIRYSLPPSGFVEGTVTDDNSGQPVANASIRVLQDGNEIRLLTSDADGQYRTMVPLGSYTVEASEEDYSSQSATVTLDTVDQVISQDFSLTPKPVCGALQQQAELGSRYGDFEIVDDISASNDKYIHVPKDSSGDDGNGPDPESRVDYCFIVPEAGNYALSGIVHASDGETDSFYVRVNEAPANGYLWAVSPELYSAFVLDYVNDQNSGADPVVLSLAAGQQFVSVYLREAGTRLDTINLEKVDAPPTLLGDVTCDGDISSVDALFILQYNVELRTDSGGCPLPDENSLNASVGDVDSNGAINAVDSLFILQCEIGISNAYCPEVTAASVMSAEEATAAQEVKRLLAKQGLWEVETADISIYVPLITR